MNTPPNTPPDAALFDMGNVLFKVQFASALARLVPPGTPDRQARLQGLYKEHEDFECGRIVEDDFIARASKRLGFHGSARTFRKAWCSNITPIEAMWEHVPQLKEAGLKLVLFSNTNSLHAAWLKATYPLDLFDGEVFSHQAGAMKPDPAIYHHAFENHNLTPARTLYIDDLAPNIETGRTLGLRCHRYNPARHHEFTRWLENELVGKPA